MQPLDSEGSPLTPGDKVLGTEAGAAGETAIVMGAEWGQIILVRYDSTGQVYSSASSLWRKRGDGDGV